MKKPEEIKCGMECIRTNAERICIKPEKGQCPRCEQLVKENLNLIHYLESRIVQVERERDAAVADLKLVRCCGTCINNEGGCTTECYIVSGRPTGWQWRGVCPENTKEDEP